MYYQFSHARARKKKENVEVIEAKSVPRDVGKH